MQQKKKRRFDFPSHTKRVRRKLRQKRFYYSVLAVFLGIMLVPIAATGLVFQGCFRDVLRQHAMAENSNKLKGLKENMEENFRLLDQIALKIALSSQLPPYAIQKDALGAIAELAPFSGLTTYIDKIVVYYGDENYLLSSSGMYSTKSFLGGYVEGDALYEAITGASAAMLYNADEFGRYRRWEHLVYIVPLSLWAQHREGACVFLLRTDALQKMMHTSLSAPSDRMLIYDSRGKLVLCSHSEDYACFSADVGFFDEERHEMVCCGTEYICGKTNSNRGYTYVWLGDKRLLFRDVNRITMIFMLLVSFTLVTDIAFVLFTMHKGYKPIESLLELLRASGSGHSDWEDSDELTTIRAAFERAYDANSEMRRSLQNNLPALREYFALNAIQGSFHSREVFDDVCRGVDLSFQYPYFLVCCIYTGKSMAFGEISPAAFSALMARSLPDGMQGVFHSCIEEGYSYGLLCVPSPDDGRLRAQMAAFAEALTSQVSCALLVSYGPASEEIGEVGRSSLLARTAMDYRFILGGQAVISPADIDACSEKKGAYPRAEIAAFEQSLSQWAADDIFPALEGVMKMMREGAFSLQQAKCVCYDIVSIFVKNVEKLNMSEAVEESRYFDLFSIAEFSTPDELIETIRLLGSHIAEFTQTKLAEQQMRVSSKYIDYLYENIGNYQFSTERMAEHFGITPQYLRRQFRKETGQPVVEYFNVIRLERAKELLITTQQDVAEIVAQIGYIDVSSFIRKFKARFGVTPGKFREMHQRESRPCE